MKRGNLRGGTSVPGLRRAARWAALFVAWACSATDLGPTPATAIATVVVNPPSTTVVVGAQSPPLQAVVTDVSGNVMQQPAVVWTIRDASIASVSATGVVQGLVVGTTEVAANINGKSGVATIVVQRAPVDSVGVSPAHVDMVTGSHRQLSAGVFDAARHTLTDRTVTWASSDATVASVDGSGAVTAVAPGNATITATAEGKSGSATVTVTPPPVAALSITPNPLATSVGSSTPLTATALDANGNVLVGRVVTWTSSNTAVATLSATCVPAGSECVTAVAAGSATITGTSEGITATAVVNVSNVAVSSVSVLPQNPTIAIGASAQLSATPHDVNGNVLTGRVVTWSSSNPAVAAVTPLGVATGVSLGSATITATSEGKTGTTTITVVSAAVGSVTLPAAATVAVGQTSPLVATVKDANGVVVTNRVVTWTSDNAAVATVSTTGGVTGVAPGTANVTATSETKSATTVVTVVLAPVASIALAPPAPSIVAGQAVTLVPTLKDANGNVLTGRTVTWSSSNAAAASVSTAGVVTGVAPGTTTVTAASEGQTATANVTVSAVPVASITVTPNPLALSTGQTAPLTATARDASGNVLVGRVASWTSANPAVATVSTAGVVTAVAPGGTTITATSEGQSGTTNVTVSPVPVAAVAVTPPTTNLFVVQTATLTAVTTDANGAVLTGRVVTWSTSDPGVATVSASGVVTAMAPGSATITAASEGKSGTATVNVALAPVAAITLAPSTSTIVVGQTVTLVPTTTDAGGHVLAGRTVTWSSSNPGSATVSASGVVTGVAAGSTTITATSEGKSTTATVNVSAVPVATVTVAPPSSSLTVGQTATLIVVVKDGNGNVLTGRTVAWTSSNPAAATVSSSGVVTAVAPGGATISATSEGISGTSSVTVSPAPVGSVTVTPPSPTMIAGQTTQLVVTLKDASGNVLTGRVVTWSSNNTAAATVSATGVVTAVSPGSATITATSEGQTGTSIVTVIPVPVASVTVTPPNTSLTVGLTAPLTATLKDASGNVLTGRVVSWTSSNTAAVTVSGSGVVTAVGPGTSTITATSEGVPGTAGVTVTLAAVATITLGPPAPSVQAGQTVTIVATLKDANGFVLTGRVVTWSSGTQSVATVTTPGASTVVTAVSPGTSLITATSEGQTATALVTVSAVPAASVTVSPPVTNVNVLQTAPLSATVKDANGNVLNGRAVTWSSSNPAVATVSSSGVVTGVSPGTGVTITATSGAASGTGTVNVSLAPVATVVVAPPTASVAVGQTTPLTVTLKDAGGNVLTGRTIVWSSSDATLATVLSNGVVTGVGAGVATITATSEGQAGASTVTVTPAPVASITVAPPAPTINAGTTVTLVPTVRDVNGNVLTGRVVTWSSSAPAFATVSTSGVVTGVAPGPATITATSEGKFTTATVTVTPAPVATVTVAPASTPLFVGQGVILSATLKDANGNVLAGRVITWGSSNTAVATVSTAGVVTAVGPGGATITATSEGQSGTASVTVSPVPVATVTVTPPTASVTVGLTTSLGATTKDANGDVLTGRTIAWSSSDITLATVSPSGVVTGIAAGPVTITATSEGKSGTAAVTVTPAPVATVVVTPPTVSVPAGQTTPLSATLKDQNGNVLTGRVIAWSSSDLTRATVSSAGVVTGVATTTTAVTITATSEGKSGSASVTVTPAPVATVTLAPLAPSVQQGQSVTLVPTLKDAQGNTLSGRTVTWLSGTPSVATVSASGVVTAVAPGTSTITATSEGQSGTATVTVTAVPVSSVAVAPLVSNLTIPQTAQLTVTLKDAGGNVLTGRTVTWASNNTAAATVSTTGLVTSVGAGTATITATSEGQNGTATVNVALAPVATVTLAPPTTSVVAAQTTTIVATLKDAGGNVLTGRTIAWTSSDQTLATVSSSGVVTGVLPGTVTITATSEGKSGTSSVTVTPAPVASVTLSPNAANVILGQTTTLTPTLKDAAGTVLTGRLITWGSSDNTVATVSSAGVVTAVKLGTATITATSEGQFATAAITVVPVPVASVSVAPLTPSVVAGQTVTLTATTKDGVGNVLTGRVIAWSSSDQTVATVASTGVVTAVAPGTATITATSEGQSGSATVTVTPAPVATVTLAPAAPSVTVGGTVTLVPTLKDAGGNTLNGRVVTWGSDNQTVATVAATGVVTAVAPGTATITATSEGKSGTVLVTVTPVPVASVAVTPAPSSVIAGQTTTLTATPKDAGGNPLSGRTVIWSTSDAGTATVSSTGVVTGVAPGTATITATSEGKLGTSIVTVAPAVASVTLAPSPPTIQVHQTETLVATLKDAGGNTLTGRPITWTTSDPTVATVSSAGLVTGTTPGPVTITATSEGKSAGATITVQPGPATTVSVTPKVDTVLVGQKVTLIATAADADGNPITGRPFAWKSSDNPTATVDATGVVTTKMKGTVTITATLDAASDTAKVTAK